MLWLPALSVYVQEQQAGDVTIHVVQRGENLFRIALGYGLTTDVVAAANGITDPSNILVGQRLIIPIDLPTLPPQSREHIVQPGESLLSIAISYELTPDFIATRNEIVDPDSIYVGQILMLDVAPASAPDQAESSESSVNRVDLTHIVQAGETLFRVATQYDTTVNALQEANGITDPTLIYAGQELLIPGVQIPELAVDLPPEVLSISVKPLFFAEGRTGSVRLSTPTVSTVAGQFLGRELTIISDTGGLNHVMLIGIPIYTAPGVYPLQFSITPSGQAAIPLSVNIQVLAGGYGTQYITLPADRAELLAPAVEDNELLILQSVTSVFNPERYFDGLMSLPAAAVMNSPFGGRRAYNGGAADRFHSGADFAGAPGSPVLAAAAGRVVLADTLHIRGVSIVIDHGWGVYTNYSHMTDRYVQTGDFVTIGQTIGTVGNTGRATGAHLHWELWVNGTPVDPMQWVSESLP